MKKLSSYLAAFLLAAVTLSGCGNAASPTPSTAAPAKEVLESQDAPSSSSGEETEPETDAFSDRKVIRVGSLKGPTSMGLVQLMNADSSANSYDFQMVTGADELVAATAAGKVDIALVPANVASVLYNKTEGGVSVIDINTLGVLYMVSSDGSIKSTADLKGKTVYLTGKGTTPDYVLRYLLKENGLTESDVALEYKSEPAEVAAILKNKEGTVGLLPQPFVTVATTQNENVKIVLDLTKEWDKLQGGEGSRLVTGVTIVRNEFLKEHEDKVKVFLADHQVSTEQAIANPDQTAEFIVKAGIIEKAPIAKKALPYCSITYLDGAEMKTALSGYLNVLFEQDPKSVGGALPKDNFYYNAKN